MKTPITRERVRHHLTYCGWMYVLLIVVAVFGWNLTYTMTEPRIPPEEQLTFYVTTSAGGTDASLSAFMEEVWEKEFPELKKVGYVGIIGTSERDMAGAVQLHTFLYAHQGDVYLLKREDYRNYGGPAVSLPLEDLVADGTLKIPEGMSVNKGYMTLSAEFEEMAGERHLYAIPCAQLPGFKTKLGIDPRDMYLMVTSYGGNRDNALKFVQYILDNFQ